MELSAIAHQRLVDAGWEIEQFESSAFGQSVDTQYLKASGVTRRKVIIAACTAAGGLAATVAGVILHPYAVAAAPFALAFACKELFVPVKIKAANEELKAIQYRSHYLEEVSKTIRKTGSILEFTKRPQMAKVALKMIKQWECFNELIPVLTTSSLDKCSLITDHANLTVSLNNILKASPGRKARQKFENAKKDACDTLGDLQNTVEQLAQKALNSCLVVQGVLFSYVQP